MSAWEVMAGQPDELGESPFWHPGEQLLYWVDIKARQVRRMDPRERSIESWPVHAEPGCIAPLASGGLVLALRDGIYRARSWRGPLELLVRSPFDQSTTRFNDGKADPVGRFWAGTVYEPRDARKAELYSLDLRESEPLLQLKAANAGSANGLAWSPDARTIYWADTANHIIHAWDWDAQGNGMGRPRVFQQFAGKPALWQPGEPGYRGRPDGAAVDAQGNYWCAMFEGACLLQFAPTGALLAQIPVPAQCPTMPCFGGADLKTLFVTTARPAGALLAQPQAGCVFAMAVAVPGLPANFVRG